MRKNVALLGVVLSFVYFGLSMPSRSAEVKSESSTGSIQGKISVSGVRSPENVLIYVEKASGEYPPPGEPAAMDQMKLMFTPRVLPIVKGTTVKFINSDPILHNVFWPKSKDGSYAARNLGTWGKGSAKEFTFDQEGSVVLLCNVHPEMEAHVIVLQNPFFAVVDKEGIYEIKNVPPGQYMVKTWYSKPKRLRSKSAEVTVEANKATTLDFSLSRKR